MPDTGWIGEEAGDTLSQRQALAAGNTREPATIPTQVGAPAPGAVPTPIRASIAGGMCENGHASATASAAASATAGISPTAAIPSTGVAGSSGAIEHAGAIQSVDLPIGSEACASDLQCAPCNAAPGEDTTVSEASAGGNAAATATSAAADVETVNEGGGTASPEVTPAAPQTGSAISHGATTASAVAETVVVIARPVGRAKAKWPSGIAWDETKKRSFTVRGEDEEHSVRFNVDVAAKKAVG